MVIRPFKISDLEIINEIHNKYYKGQGYDSIDAAQAYADIVADKDGALVAYGLNRLLSESVMVLDHSLSTRDKVDALTLLMKEAKHRCCHRQLFVRVQDPQFGEILKKHFRFQESKGILLVSDLEFINGEC